MAGFGVFISGRHVLAHTAALDGRSSVPLSGAGGSSIDALVVAYDPPTGLVLLQTDLSEGTEARLALQPPAAGALAAGIGRAEGQEIALPVFISEVRGDRYALGAVGDSVPPGLPLFNLEGELLAIVAAGREPYAIPPRSAVDRLLARVATGERLSALGLGFQAPSGLLTAAFGEQGVVITHVIDGGPADSAGIRAGDVLLEVGDITIDSADTATRVFGSRQVGAPVRVRLRREGRLRQVDVTPALAYQVAALGSPLFASASGPDARTLFTAALLERAAVPPSARVLSINGRVVTSRAQAQRELRVSREPIPVLVQHGDRRFFVAIDPAR
jgi:S1-C subfamily serine protease